MYRKFFYNLNEAWQRKDGNWYDRDPKTGEIVQVDRSSAGKRKPKEKTPAQKEWDAYRRKYGALLNIFRKFDAQADEFDAKREEIYNSLGDEDPSPEQKKILDDLYKKYKAAYSKSRKAFRLAKELKEPKEPE